MRPFGIPPAPLLLGLAGLIPFLWGAATALSPGLWRWGADLLGQRFVAPFVGLSYGTVILSFMSGVTWGFATRADARAAPALYGLSVLPALWAFFFVGGGPTSAATFLVAGFIGLLGIDWTAQRLGLAPSWWMALRLILTAGVVLSLLPLIL
ncbi:uncharacterized protein DUF3429 [Hasllibacter halocynthiae]|uniref:Uncharacterized protein DUF3429 n=1 Tax=Hasllibacter halocynthiae TaxID=595589 RepID=A0A2T0X3C6_9RHOB|nr:DUF3429 domain-containing protein [Hasllibacter halocynthiae]PRY93417.1 uncharacterized protein DUF3429 [Hasllibacter halocynthiae]